eukprot:TRINITY_DN29895_c0_g2_i1.p1 TRINITY_DN29895_c0_g2~~TRINITY_DN29895_c0_g2_i1.p1  ORF type:complete len:229 (+),score=41.52 TRINITY_DN29895_c0_g2_i1:46-732(+)
MKFFSNQRIDDAGNTAVRLQKIFIFLFICDIIFFVLTFPYSIVSLLISACVLSIGFFGAKNRHRGLLLTYAIIKIVGFVLQLIFAIFVAIIAVVLVLGFVLVLLNAQYMDYTVDFYYDYYDYFNISETFGIELMIGSVAFIIMALIIAVISLVTFCLILYTVVLAFRMRRQLKESQSYVSVSTVENPAQTPGQTPGQVEMQSMGNVAYLQTPEGVVPVLVVNNPVTQV